MRLHKVASIWFINIKENRRRYQKFKASHFTLHTSQWAAPNLCEFVQVHGF
jgi:hypothetical protein